MAVAEGGVLKEPGPGGGEKKDEELDLLVSEYVEYDGREPEDAVVFGTLLGFAQLSRLSIFG